MRNRRVKNMNTNKMETVIKVIWNLKVKLQETKTKRQVMKNVKRRRDFRAYFERL